MFNWKTEDSGHSQPTLPVDSKVDYKQVFEHVGFMDFLNPELLG